MRLEVFDQRNNDDVLRLKLFHNTNLDRVELMVVDSNGHQVPGGLLLSVDGKGVFRKFYGVNTLIGVQVDGSGRVMFQDV